MLDRRATFVSLGPALATILAVLSGCADEDPRFGPAGASKNIRVFEPSAAPAPEAGAGAKARDLFTPVWTSLRVDCARCHEPPGQQGAAIFLNADEQKSYDEFKLRRYHIVGGKPPGRMYSIDERGPHSGDPLKEAQKSLIAQWRAAEAAEAAADAGAGPTDAGGGG